MVEFSDFDNVDLANFYESNSYLDSFNIDIGSHSKDFLSPPPNSRHLNLKVSNPEVLSPVPQPVVRNPNLTSHKGRGEVKLTSVYKIFNHTSEVFQATDFYDDMHTLYNEFPTLNKTLIDKVFTKHLLDFKKSHDELQEINAKNEEELSKIRYIRKESKDGSVKKKNVLVQPAYANSVSQNVNRLPMSNDPLFRKVFVREDGSVLPDTFSDFSLSKYNIVTINKVNRPPKIAVPSYFNNAMTYSNGFMFYSPPYPNRRRSRLSLQTNSEDLPECFDEDLVEKAHYKRNVSQTQKSVKDEDEKEDNIQKSVRRSRRKSKQSRLAENFPKFPQSIIHPSGSSGIIRDNSFGPVKRVDDEASLSSTYSANVDVDFAFSEHQVVLGTLMEIENTVKLGVEPKEISINDDNSKICSLDIDAEISNEQSRPAKNSPQFSQSIIHPPESKKVFQDNSVEPNKQGVCEAMLSSLLSVIVDEEFAFNEHQVVLDPVTELKDTENLEPQNISIHDDNSKMCSPDDGAEISNRIFPENDVSSEFSDVRKPPESIQRLPPGESVINTSEDTMQHEVTGGVHFPITAMNSIFDSAPNCQTYPDARIILERLSTSGSDGIFNFQCLSDDIHLKTDFIIGKCVKY